MEPIEKATFIYVVAQQDGSQPWKIGKTQDPVQRLKSHQAGSPVPLVYMKIVQAHPDLEKSLHRQFAKYRTHGEWFHLSEANAQMVLDRLDGLPWVVTVREKKSARGNVPGKSWYKGKPPVKKPANGRLRVSHMVGVPPGAPVKRPGPIVSSQSFT